MACGCKKKIAEPVQPVKKIMENNQFSSPVQDSNTIQLSSSQQQQIERIVAKINEMGNK